MTPPTFLGLWLTDGRSWDPQPPKLHEPKPYNKSLLHTHIHPTGPATLENPDEYKMVAPISQESLSLADFASGHAGEAHVAKNCTQPVGTECGLLWPTASKKLHPHSYNLKKRNSANNLGEPGSRCFPGQASDETAAPANA